MKYTIIMWKKRRKLIKIIEEQEPMGQSEGALHHNHEVGASSHVTIKISEIKKKRKKERWGV